MSLEEFTDKQAQYIAAVAAAVGVPATSVSVLQVSAEALRRALGLELPPRRSLLSQAVEVRTLINGATPGTAISKAALDDELRKAGLPASRSLSVDGLTLGGMVPSSMGKGTVRGGERETERERHAEREFVCVLG
jgi:hypothetical protein